MPISKFCSLHGAGSARWIASSAPWRENKCAHQLVLQFCMAPAALWDHADHMCLQVNVQDGAWSQNEGTVRV